MVHVLSAATTVVQSASEGDKRVVAVFVEPAVSEVSVLHFRHVGKAVMILIHCHKRTSVVRHEAGV